MFVMSVLRKIFLTLLVLGLGGLLFLNASAWVTRQTVMDRSVTKSWLSEGKIYDNFVNELAKLVEKEQTKSRGPEASESDANVDMAALARAAKAAFPPNVLQANVESILTSAYDWLEGKTDKLNFNLDLADEKQAFIDALGNEAIAKLSSLPACTNEQISEDFDLFSAGCLPSGTDINAQVSELKNEIASSDSILPDTQLSGDDIKVNVGGEQQTLDQAFPDAPKWYGWFRSSPLLLGVLVIVNSGLIFLLSRPKRKGFKKLAWLFGLTATALLLIGGAGSIIGNQLGKGSFKLGAGQDGFAENLLLPLVRQVSSSFSKWHLIIGGVYLGIAVICIVVYLLLKKKNPEVVVPKADDKKEVEPKEEAAPTDKDVKKPTLVQ